MSHTSFRLPAEWERQSATLLAWPHAASDWAERLPAIHEEYRALIKAIAAHQRVILLVPPGNSDAADQLQDCRGLDLVELHFNDTWCRDYGPITLVDSGQRLALDFHFNGWGGKYPASLDNRVNTLLARNELFQAFTFRQYLFELEGGAIDCDGQGTLLVNWHCLHARHPHLSRREIDHELHSLLNLDRIIGIDLEPMTGDDTDGHIDTLARFINPDTIVFQSQSEDARTRRLREQLESLRRSNGEPYELIALPWPKGIDQTLPANYVNFLFVNDACLVPAYGADSDDEARAILDEALPDHAIERVPARVMIGQFGGPHCASMQIPANLG
jgi:agmatine/peptidylarginine deiminase